MQRLAATEHGGNRLVGHSHQIDFGLLVLQRATGRLGVETQLPRGFFLSAVLLPKRLRPDYPRSAILGDFLEDIVVSVKEKAEPRGEVVDIHAAGQAGVDIVKTVGQCESKLLD